MLNAETNDTAATVAEQGAPVAPEKTTPTKATSRKKGAPKSRKKGKAAKPSAGAAKEKKPAKSKNAPNRQGKGAKILEMIGRAPGPIIRSISQGYEQGGLVYFTFEDREMVAIVRDRAEFDKHRERGTALQAYCNSLVSDKAYGAALALEELIPK